MQSGNYLALHFEVPESATAATVELVNGTDGPKSILDDEEKICIFRITNKNTQYIQYKVTINGVVYTKNYNLKKLRIMHVD